MSSPRSSLDPFAWVLAAITLFAVWLRVHGITGQVLLDDEWHAIHKLIASSYGDILETFGVADHSIPLTLLYKAMAGTVGLAEGRIRVPQVVCGSALVALCGWTAARATGDRAAAALFAVLVAAAPFLVMWSRFARPYAITLFLDAVCVAALWAWRERRTRKLAVVVVATAALATWFHPLAGLVPVVGCLFVFFEDAARLRVAGARPCASSAGLGIAVALAMAALVALPLWNDLGALQAKAGGDRADAQTFEGALAIFWGGIPTPAMWIASAIAIWGVAAFSRRDAPLALLLLLVAVAPVLVVLVLGAVWVHIPGTFARYILVAQPIMLFFASYGAIALVRALSRSREAIAWTAAGALAAGYLAATPTIVQVLTLGPWYAHQDYHWDYRRRGNVAKRDTGRWMPPAFYRELAAMPPGAAPVIEAPFEWEAPFDPFSVYATYHRQPERFGMLRDVCGVNAKYGEVPARDRRFRFRSFVFLDDVDGVRRSGAAYLLLHLRLPPRPAYPQARRCLDRLTQLYGPPVSVDDQLAVFDLARVR